MRIWTMAAVALPFGAGILACEHLGTAFCCLIAAAAAWTALALVESRRRATVCIVGAMFVLGVLRHGQAKLVSPEDVSRFIDKGSAIEGFVASDPDVDPDRMRFLFRVQRARVGGRWTEANGSAMVSVYREAGARTRRLNYGDRARIRARLYAPLEPTNPGSFSWKSYLARQGIYACASVRESSQIRILPGARGNPVVRAALWMRRLLEESIARIHPEPEASVVVGMVLGTYTHLPDETLRGFSRTGTLHLLAASGYNCYIILLITTPVLRKARILPKWRNGLIVLLILAYLMMAGAKASLVRAAVMASLFLLATPLRRSANWTNLFYTAAFVMLLIHPADLFDIGFQLSFVSAWALISVAPILEPLLSKVTPVSVAPRRAGYIVTLARRTTLTLQVAAISTAAISLVTGPLVAQYFNYVSLVSIPANMAIALGVPVVFADGFAAPLVANIPVLSAVIGALGTWVVHTMLDVVNGLGSLSWAAVSIPSPGVAGIAGYYILLYAALYYLRSRNAQE